MGESRGSLIESLFKDRELYNILFENADDAMLFIEESRIIDCNKTAIKLLGYQEKSEFINEYFFKFSPELQSDGENSEQKAQNLFSVVQTETSPKIKWELKKADKTILSASLILKKLQLENHSCLQITIQEISAKNDETDELIRVKAFLTGLIETIPQPLFSKDENFKYNYCNQAFTEYIGKSKEEIIGSSVFQVSDIDKAEIYHLADLDAFEKSGNQVYQSTVKFNDGTDHQVIFHKNTIADTSDCRL